MNKQELNRDIKRLFKRFEAAYGKHKTDEFHEAIRKEWTRLYYADLEAEYLNKFSILALHRINIAYRYKALHAFGSNFVVNNK